MAESRTNPALPEDTLIHQDENGTYAWRATLDLKTNQTMLILTAKIIGIIMGSLFAIFVVIAEMSSLGPEQYRMLIAICVPIAIFVAVVAILAYLGYAAAIGWTYRSDVLMDETGIICRPAPKEDSIAKGVATGAAVAAALAGSYGVTAAGIAATNTEAASKFASVRKVKGIRKQCCIKVSQPLLYNQVYVAPQDYDFVYQFISGHCPKAKCEEA